MSQVAVGGTMQGQAAVVVGAGGGIGRATALWLGVRGVKVICADQRPEPAEEAAKLVIAAGGEAFACGVDITSVRSVQAVKSEVLRTTPRIHILVNAAGIQGPIGPRSHEVGIDQFRQVCEVNLVGPLILSHVFIPHMIESGYGRIVHVASMAGKEGNGAMAAYSASKAGLIGLVKCQGKEYASDGLIVNALAPAFLDTAFNQAHTGASRAELLGRIPMQRVGTAAEAAAILGWMVSPECSFTTGFTFDLSGGRATY